MGNRTGGYGQPQPSQFQQPRNMMRGPTEDEIRSGYTPRPQTQAPQNSQTSWNPAMQGGPMDVASGPNRAALAQQRRNRAFSAAQNPVNLYDGGGANHISAVMGSNLGQGDPNKGYILHDFGGGKYGYNQGNLDPTMQYLTGDYSRWFK